ncbi:MAG: GspH/FimT family pseudopilin [Legionella sp.]|nr:GspH/FimT family pseudopilin [Legionella sp.]
MKLKGFTLIELMITVVVVAVLSTIGIASYTYLLRKNEQQTILDELRTAVQFAKIQAMITGRPVYLSPVDALSGWSNGLKLSALNQQTHKMDLLYQWQWQHPRWRLTWKGAQASDKIVVSNNPATAITNGRFSLVNVDSHQHVGIILNRLGRIRLSNSLSEVG